MRDFIACGTCAYPDFCAENGCYDNREVKISSEEKEELPLAKAVRLARGTGEPPSKPIRFSSWENCPLCNSMLIEVHEDQIYKPEVVCTECGISLQGETVFEIKQKWNTRAK